MWYVSWYLTNFFSTSSDSSESSPWQPAGKAYVDYVSALVASRTRRRTSGTWSSTRLPTRNSTNIIRRACSSRETTNFLLLASPGADHLKDGWRRWVARGLQHLGSGLRRRRRQAAAVILICRSRRLSDPEESPGAEGEGPGCERTFLSQVHGNELGAERAGGPESRLRIHNVLYNSIHSIVI